MARIDNLTNYLTDIASAIKNKKGDESPIKASEFDTEIENLPSGGGKYAPTYVYNFTFQSYTGNDLTYETENLDTRYFTTLANMFYGCTLLRYLNVSQWNVDNVTNMNYMFYNCNKLCQNPDGTYSSLNVKKWNTEKVETMDRAFYAVPLDPLDDISQWDVRKVRSMQYTFNGDSAMLMGNEKLDLSGWHTDSLENINYIFNRRKFLRKLDIRNFNFDKVTTYSSAFDNFYADCEIIVNSEKEKTWLKERFDHLTNIKTIEEVESYNITEERKNIW